MINFYCRYFSLFAVILSSLITNQGYAVEQVTFCRFKDKFGPTTTAWTVQDCSPRLKQILERRSANLANQESLDEVNKDTNKRIDKLTKVVEENNKSQSRDLKNTVGSAISDLETRIVGVLKENNRQILHEEVLEKLREDIRAMIREEIKIIASDKK